MTRLKLARAVAALLAILIVIWGVGVDVRYGGICALAIDQVLAACPLGFLERSLAAREQLPQLWLGTALVMFSVVLLGRVFCAWVCPAGLVRQVARGNGRLKSKRPATPNGTTWASFSPYAVLAAVLAASFLLRFPVFCFFCPIGLVFGSLFAVMKVVTPDPLSAELVLLPALLGLELFALKSWCRSLCPLGALLSLASRVNHFIRPTIKQATCLVSQGIDCQACRNACPEGVDLRKQRSGLFVQDCTKCLECYDKCPARAIKIAVLS